MDRHMLAFDDSPTTPADWTIRNYMRWMHDQHRRATGKVVRRPPAPGVDAEVQRGIDRCYGGETEKRQASLCWAQLRDARVFHVGDELVKHTHLKIHRWLTEAVAGFDYESFWDDDVEDVETAGADWDHLIDSWKEASVHAPWPERFVFPNMLLGYGEGYTLDWTTSMHKLRALESAELLDELDGTDVLAHLITESGYVWELVRLRTLDGGEFFWTEPFRMPEWMFGEMATGMRTDTTRHPPGWLRSFDTTQYLVPALVHLMTQYRTLVVEADLGKDNKRTFRHNRKKLGLGGGSRRRAPHAPPPFYRVKLKTKVVDEVPEYLKNNTPRRLTYRHDVRGHERCKIQRGTLPMDPKLRKQLVARGYRVYDDPGKVPDEDVKRLITRGHPLRRDDEWIAVRSHWVRPFVRGDESLPYVPALRVATGGGK